MKYIGMSQGMWTLFKNSFRKNLQTTLNFSAEESKSITATAYKKYKEIIRSLPEFERADRFKMNIISCAMLAGFYLITIRRLPMTATMRVTIQGKKLVRSPF